MCASTDLHSSLVRRNENCKLSLAGRGSSDLECREDHVLMGGRIPTGEGLLLGVGFDWQHSQWPTNPRRPPLTSPPNPIQWRLLPPDQSPSPFTLPPQPPLQMPHADSNALLTPSQPPPNKKNHPQILPTRMSTTTLL